MCLYYVEAGKDGLKKAEEKYDPKADFSFDSYAVWWIRQRSHLGFIQYADSFREGVLAVRLMENCSTKPKEL